MNSAADIWERVLSLMQQTMTETTITTWFSDAEPIALDENRFILYVPTDFKRENRLGLTTGTKLGHAVVRNRVRRRLREIYRLQEHRLSPGYDIVVVARVRAVYSRYAELERDFLRLAKKLQLLSPQGSDAEGEKP